MDASKPRPKITPLRPDAGDRPEDSEHQVSMNFKMPFEFRQRFKMYAVRRGISMTGLLRKAFFELLRNEEKDEGK